MSLKERMFRSLKINNIKYFFKYIINFLPNKINYPEVRENTVLLIEFYLYHGECIPGIIKYLLDLNYNVDVAIRKPEKKGRNDLGLFYPFISNEKVRIITLSEFNLNYLLRSNIIKKYINIIIMTFYDKTKKQHLLGVNLFKLKPICSVHHSDLKNKYFKTNKIISHVEIKSKNRMPTKVVSSHFFGNYERKKKSDITSFIFLNSKDKNTRDVSVLFDACNTLKSKGITKYTIKSIGKGLSIPDCYSDIITDFGFQDYQQMFNEINKSDFFLPLINKSHVQYTNKASGAYNISYGFLIPLVMHGIFSGISGINNENGIIYDDEDVSLADAMEKCINMTKDEYKSIINELEKLQNELYNASLNNLKEVLEAEFEIL